MSPVASGEYNATGMIILLLLLINNHIINNLLLDFIMQAQFMSQFPTINDGPSPNKCYQFLAGYVCNLLYPSFILFLIHSFHFDYFLSILLAKRVRMGRPLLSLQKCVPVSFYSQFILVIIFFDFYSCMLWSGGTMWIYGTVSIMPLLIKITIIMKFYFID